jgi:hypothetical protein
MKALFSLTFSLLLAATVTTAQDYSFKVLATKGNNEFKSGDTWQPIKTGAALRENDEIKLLPNSYLGLVHVTGKPLEVKIAGNYKVTELIAKVSQKTTVLQKYTDFILSSRSAEAQKNKLNATGAVHRGDASVAPLQLLLPEKHQSGLFNTTAILSWAGTEVPGPYVVTIKNMFDEEIKVAETIEQYYELNLSDEKLKPLNAILVEVKAKSNGNATSKQHMIKRLPAAEQQNIKNEFDILLAEVGAPSAAQKIILAQFYESRNLLVDAVSAYEEAIRLEPEIEDYKDLYNDFLIRQGIRK